jgi:uncharacterized RDD family membrane protein YckC
MEFTKGAKELIEKNLKEIMELMTLSQADKAEIEKELRSNFYEGSEANAKERGAAAIAEEDVMKAFYEQGSPKEICAEYMRSYGAGLKRAGFWWRSLAYIIDIIVIGICIGIIASPFILISLVAQSMDKSTTLDVLIVFMNMVIGLISFGILICYFVIMEGMYSRTIGKYITGLKTIKANGLPLDYKDALLRNVPKFFGNFIIIDALIMVIFFGKEKQRAFDKVADTIVVHVRG